MTIRVLFGQSDPVVERLIEVLRRYESDHPSARIDIYRRDRFSVRIRVIDDSFAGMSRVERHELVWSYLDQAPDAAIEDISTVLTLMPGEVEKSFASVEFENPVPSEF